MGKKLRSDLSKDAILQVIKVFEICSLVEKAKPQKVLKCESCHLNYQIGDVW